MTVCDHRHTRHAGLVRSPRTACLAKQHHFIKVGRDNVVMTAWSGDEYEEPIDELHTDEIKHIMAFLDEYANAVV